MQYELRTALLLPILLLLTACASGPPIAAPATACAALLPEAWQSPVPGAPLPRDASLPEWMVFGDAQTAQLDKANDRTASAIQIVTRCEARDREAVARMRKRWWQVWR